MLSIKEELILDHLAHSPSTISQRELAQKAGVSVGLLNLVLKRLITTGYVKVSSLNKRKLEYLLTPEGFTAQTKRSLNYIRETIQHYHEIDSRLRNIFSQLIENGHNRFFLFGDGELISLVLALLHEKNIEPISDLSLADSQSVLIKVDGEDTSNFPGKVINIHKELTRP